MKSYEERELSSGLRSLAATIEVPTVDLRSPHRTRRNLATGFAGVALAIVVVVAAIAAITSARSAIGNPSPTATRPPSRSIQTTPVSSIPREFAYVEASPGRDVNLWLVDLSGATPPVSVARWAGGNGTYSASRDGKTIIIAAPGERSLIALHLLDPLTGQATVLFEGPSDGRVFYPRLSPDGKRFAFMVFRQQGSDGIWVGDLTDGRVRQLYAPSREDPTLFGWSDDSQWVTYSAPDEANLSSGPHIFLHNVVDGRRINAGTGSVVSWRATEPRVLMALGGGKGNQGAFGATVYTLDLASGRRTELFSIDPRLAALAWNPTHDEFLYLASDTGCNFGSSIWVRSPGASVATPVGDTQRAQAAWWSSDGETIYALIAGASIDAIVVNAMTGQRIATIPQAGPPGSCP
jgi:Tol biopolymer transport system component